tara:strand:+ start:2863 stop:3075 length:213 start_codon:yes stop_codon:yes gene_type:complete
MTPDIKLTSSLVNTEHVRAMVKALKHSKLPVKSDRTFYECKVKGTTIFWAMKKNRREDVWLVRKPADLFI